MNCYIVFKSVSGSYYYKENEFNSPNTYKNKPIAIFFARKDAFEYVRYYNSQFFNEEDDGPENIWAIENGYI